MTKIIVGILEARESGKVIDEKNNFFVVTGCIITREQYKLLEKQFEALKNKFWEKGMYYDESKKTKYKVCLHSSDIRRRQKCFQNSIVDHSTLCQEISNIISEIDFKIISVAVDVNRCIERKEDINAYNVAMDILTNEFVREMAKGEKGIIVLEARGKKEDNAVYQHMKEIISNIGTKEYTKEELEEHIQAIYFNSKYNKGKSMTYSGLELADLCSYPIFKYIKTRKKDMAYKAIENKLMVFPKDKERGIIRIP